MKRWCLECEEAKAILRDPRVPPLDIGKEVLCDPCFQAAAEDRIEELTAEINDLRDEMAS